METSIYFTNDEKFYIVVPNGPLPSKSAGPFAYQDFLKRPTRASPEVCFVTTVHFSNLDQIERWHSYYRQTVILKNGFRVMEVPKGTEISLGGLGQQERSSSNITNFNSFSTDRIGAKLTIYSKTLNGKSQDLKTVSQEGPLKSDPISNIPKNIADTNKEIDHNAQSQPFNPGGRVYKPL